MFWLKNHTCHLEVYKKDYLFSQNIFFQKKPLLNTEEYITSNDLRNFKGWNYKNIFGGFYQFLGSYTGIK